MFQAIDVDRRETSVSASRTRSLLRTGWRCRGRRRDAAGHTGRGRTQNEGGRVCAEEARGRSDLRRR